MKRYLIFLCFLLLGSYVKSQAYIKLELDRGDSLNTCDNSIDVIPYAAANGPYVITWWDNSWSPSSGFHAQNICEGKGITVELVDMNCNHLRAYIQILPTSVQQVYLDSVIAILPSVPGGCDGSLSFFFANVQASDVRKFGDSGSGSTTTLTVFNGLCEDYYHYSIYRSASLICEVHVSLNYPPLNPCMPFKDSLVVIPQSSPGSCDASVYYNTEYYAGGVADFMHSIYKPVGGGSVVINSDSLTSYTGLCAGPYIIHTDGAPINNNQYFVENKIFVDEPLLQDSIWGNPSSSQVDTILLQALTNCSINYTYNVDSVYISNMTYIASNQYEFEIAVIQSLDTLYSYETATVDTSHQLCFDLTFFCADSSGFGTMPKTISTNQLHSYLYFKVSGGVITNKNKIDFNEKIVVFPIPANNQIVINDLPKGSNQIKIYGVDGRLFKSEVVRSMTVELDVSDYQNGIYIINVFNIDNNRNYFNKIIVSH